MRLSQRFEVTQNVRDRWRKILPWILVVYVVSWGATILLTFAPRYPDHLGWVPKVSPLIGLILSFVAVFSLLLYMVATMVFKPRKTCPPKEDE